MNKNILLFIFGVVLTFTFITLLQFTNPPLFFIFLVLMHVGIFCFIISRRGFRKQGIEVAKFYKIQYILLAPYLLIMLYKILTSVGILPMLEDVKAPITLAFTAIAVIVSAFNIGLLCRQCRGLRM